jgi:hypothetical protein
MFVVHKVAASFTSQKEYSIQKDFKCLLLGIINTDWQVLGLIMLQNYTIINSDQDIWRLSPHGSSEPFHNTFKFSILTIPVNVNVHTYLFIDIIQH